MKDTLQDLLKQLTEVRGPSGFEEPVRDLIRGQVDRLADAVHVDRLGNLHAVVRGEGSGLRMMVAAHMDEIGLMVTHVDEQGFARFTYIGDLWAATLVGNRFVFANGVVGVVNVEKFEKRPKIESLEKFFLDFGASDRASCPVRVGDVATFDRPFLDLGARWVSKAMDDRLGCATLIEVMRRLAKQTPHEIHFVFTVQEELASQGAMTAAFAIQPHVSIALGVTGSGDLPESSPFPVVLGNGPAIRVSDTAMLVHAGVKEWMVHTADDHGIPYQTEVIRGMTTDAEKMQRAGSGSAVGVLSVPCRHLHTSSEMVDAGDVRHTVDLMVALLSGPVDLESTG
jgi:putative aminopeptidase FrvX